MLLYVCTSLYAQSEADMPLPEPEEDPIEELLDSLMVHYQYDFTSSTAYDTLILNTRNYRSNAIPTFSTDVIQTRL